MTVWSCVNRNNRKATSIKQFLLKQVFLVCTQLESARGGLFLSFRKILTFVVSSFWRREALHRSLIAACSALPWAALHTPWAGRGAHSGSKPSAAGSQLCSLGTSIPWQEEGPATRVSQGQFLRCHILRSK